jgi:hypothetical protein
LINDRIISRPTYLLLSLIKFNPHGHVGGRFHFFWRRENHRGHRFPNSTRVKMITTDQPCPVSVDKLSQLQLVLNNKSYDALFAYINLETSRDKKHRARFTATVDTTQDDSIESIDPDLLIEDEAANEFIVEKVVAHHEL